LIRNVGEPVKPRAAASCSSPTTVIWNPWVSSPDWLSADRNKAAAGASFGQWGTTSKSMSTTSSSAAPSVGRERPGNWVNRPWVDRWSCWPGVGRTRFRFQNVCVEGDPVHDRGDQPWVGEHRGPRSKSTSVSAPGSWVCGTFDLDGHQTQLRPARATYRDTVDSDTTAWCSATSRWHSRRAVCRCLRGTSRSASNQKSMNPSPVVQRRPRL